MSLFSLAQKTSLSVTGALGIATLGLWVTACGSAESANPSGGTAGTGTGGAGPSSGGSPVVDETGGATTGGAVDTGGSSTGGPPGGDSGTTAGSGGSDSGTAGSGADGGGGSGGLASGGMGGSGGGSAGTNGGGVVTPVPLDAALMSHCTGSKPIKCTFPVPADGNFNVTVELGSATAASTSQVEVQMARIVVPALKLAAGTYSQQTFSVSVHNETHDDYTAPDKQLSVLIDGDAPALHGIGYAAANIPTLFVVGDSTVCDWSPDTHAQRGWAQEFSMYLKPGLAVGDYADSGDTAGSLYPKFKARAPMMKKGDYLFIQFGHNDMKIASEVTAYKANLMKYVTDARTAGATPVLFSPVARRGYLTDTTKLPTLADPGFNGLDQQARDLAAAEKIAFVDLTALALTYYGTVPTAPLFYRAGETTHFSIAGATAISKLVADALKAGTTPTTSVGDFLK